MLKKSYMPLVHIGAATLPKLFVMTNDKQAEGLAD